MPAHVEATVEKLWIGDYAANLLGCVEQYQICNPNIPGDAGCTTLDGSYPTLLQTALPQYKMNSYQLETVIRFLAINFRSIFWTVQGRGVSALNGLKAHSPRNQR
jgi:hypothetical protein